MGRTMSILRLFKLGSRPSGAVAAPWAPTDIDGVKLWVDANDADTITELSDAVSKWEDKGPDGYHLEQGNGCCQPLTGQSTMNDLNVITWSTDLLLNAVVLDLTDVTVFFVGVANDSSLGTYLTSTRESGEYVRAYDGGGAFDQIGFAMDDAGVEVLDGSDHFMVTKHIMSFTYDSTSETTNFYLNGGLEDTGTGAAHGNFIFNALGATQSTAGPWDGDIAEVIIYNSKLGDDDRALVNTYLGDKWGITLA